MEELSGEIADSYDVITGRNLTSVVELDWVSKHEKMEERRCNRGWGNQESKGKRWKEKEAEDIAKGEEQTRKGTTGICLSEGEPKDEESKDKKCWKLGV